MRWFLTFSMVILVVLGFRPVMAGEIEHAGMPVPTKLSTETPNYSDIYTRQLAYRIEANELRRRIYERQDNFQVPAIAARVQYEENMDALNKIRGTQDVSSAEIPSEEAAFEN